MSRFGGGNRTEKKKTVIEKIKAFFEKYFGLVTDDADDRTPYYPVTDPASHLEETLRVAEPANTEDFSE